MASSYGRLLRVNLSTGKHEKSQLDEDLLKSYVGCEGVGARLLWDEMSAETDALSPEAKFVIVTGPVTGTICPSGGSYEICFKSPATGGWGYARSGGRFGPVLRYAGYDFIVIEGRAEEPVYLSIDNENVEIKRAGHLWGLGMEEVTDRLIGKKSGMDVSVAGIGQAGENGVLFAALMNDRGRAAARGGPGAVLGSKNLKCILVHGTQPIRVADAQGLMALTTTVEEELKSYPLYDGLIKMGTCSNFDSFNDAYILPTRNFRAGSFGGYEPFTSPRLNHDYNIKRRACYGCSFACGRYTEVKSGRWACEPGEGPEYETLDMLGPNCGIGEVDYVIHMGQLANDYGLDTISLGNAMSFAIDCFENGVLTLEDTEGVPLNWGNTEVGPYLIEKIVRRDGIGELLSLGVKRAAEKLGPQAEKFAIHSKGLEMAAHEGRSESKLLALQYAVNPQGAGHVHPNWPSAWDFGIDMGMVEFGLEWPPEDVYIESRRKGAGYKYVVLAGMVSAVTGACIFYSWGSEGSCITPKRYTDFINAILGWNFTTEDLIEATERTWNIIRCFNNREGFSRQDDWLPRRLYDPLEDCPLETQRHTVDNLEPMIDAYYEALGWERETGNPKPETLARLGMQDISAQISMTLRESK